MEMFMKVNTKMECFMVEVCFIIMFNSILTRKVNTYMMDNLNKDKNMALVKNVTLQVDVMKGISSTIKNMDMVNWSFLMDPIM